MTIREALCMACEAWDEPHAWHEGGLDRRPTEGWSVTGGWRMRCTGRLPAQAFQPRCTNNSIINRERCAAHGGLDQ